MAQHLRERTPHLALRVFFALALVGVAIAALSNASGSVELTSNPRRAYGRVGWGLFPAGRLADAVLIDEPNATGMQEAVRLAQLSLTAQGLNAQALRVLGIAADKKGDPAHALALIKMSDRLSRRDLGTQIWLVNHNAALNDAAESLRHYDTVLRASNDIQPILFPILQRALGEPGIRAAFAPYIRGGAPWLPNFLAYQISSSVDPSHVAKAITEAGGLPARPDLYRALESQLLAQLADSRHFDVLRAFYLGLPGAKADVLTSVGFSASTVDQRFVPLTWKISEAAAITSAFEDDQTPGLLAFHIMAGTGEHGAAGTKLVLLPPGHYRIATSVRFLRRGTGSALAWGIKCLSTGADLPLTDVGHAPHLTASEFDVTPACQAQQLMLVVSGGDPADGSELYASGVTLSRLGDPVPPKPKAITPQMPTASPAQTLF